MKLTRLFRGAKGSDDPLHALEVDLRDLADRLRTIESELAHIRASARLLPAIVRKLYLGGLALPPPFDLTAERFGVMSQNAEDGLLLAIFRRVGTTDRRFVDIGCGVNGGNSGFLARECGWGGLMVDAQGSAIDKIAVLFAGYCVTPLRRKVTRESLNGMLKKFGYTGEVDCFSIDVDGVDFWLWDGLEVCRPRVLVIEYNYLFGKDHAVTVPYDPAFDLKTMPTRAYRGASLPALVRLGRRKGYRLVATEHVNAFFVREDLGPDPPACDSGLAYRAPGNRVKDVFGKLATFGLPLVPVDEDGRPGVPIDAGTLR